MPGLALGGVMSNPNLLIFAPREEPQDILDTLRNAGLELS